MPTCAICGKELPNRYAVAGTCEETGCEAAFCSLHWREGNQRCRAHGWESQSGPGHGGSPVSGKSNAIESVSEEKVDPEKAGHERTKRAVKGALRFTIALGRYLTEKLKMLWKKKTPQERIKELESPREDIRAEREGISQKLESLYAQIVHKKKEYAAAPKARRRVLKTELEGLLSEHKRLERRLGIHLENEQKISAAVDGLEDVRAYGMGKGVSEDLIDDVSDDLDEAADEAEGHQDALRGLERAGKRREREEDDESFEEELESFGEEEEEETAEKGAAGEGETKTDPSRSPMTLKNRSRRSEVF